ncbi:MAG: hypothetical protein WCT36_03850 [Candidatus Gracilibacteria bacterium]|jgi:hypothetical protein
MEDLINRLALSEEEDVAHRQYCAKVLKQMEDVGITPDQIDRKETDMGVMRDIQARRIPPNTRVPARRNILSYLQTITNATGSLGTAIRCLLSPGSWTTSGGSHKLATDNGIPLQDVLEGVIEDQGSARFLEVGGGYAGLQGMEKEGYEPKGIGELIAHFGDRVGATLDIHFTNLSQWYKDLPKGVTEHAGFIGSTLKKLEKEGIDLGSVDVIYSQCAAYFDRRITMFIEQSATILKSSKNGGYLIFNGKTEEDAAIMQTAEKNGLVLERKKVLGGMNGTFYIFKKQFNQ